MLGELHAVNCQHHFRIQVGASGIHIKGSDNGHAVINQVCFGVDRILALILPQMDTSIQNGFPATEVCGTGNRVGEDAMEFVRIAASICFSPKSFRNSFKL